MGRISLDSLCGGELAEKVAMALAQVGQNIMNPNTDAEKARKMTITFTFKPDDSRQVVSTSGEVKTALAPLHAAKTTLLVGQDLQTGRIEMSEYGNPEGRVVVATGRVPAAPQRSEAFDPDTGEIIEAQEVNGQREVVDLRQRA